MSETLETILTKNPLSTVREVLKADSGAREWVNDLFGVPVPLEPDDVFLDTLLRDHDGWRVLKASVTYWDPYGEGYDEGPGDLTDCWHTDGRTSTGQYRGTVITGEVSDKLGAALVSVYDIGGDGDDVLDFLRKNWVPPAGQDVRDERAAKEIREQWGRLSAGAKRALLVELSVAV